MSVSFKHLTRGLPEAIGNRLAAEHAGQLVHSTLGIQPPNGRPRATAVDTLCNLKVGIGVRGDLRKVRDTQHLER